MSIRMMLCVLLAASPVSVAADGGTPASAADGGAVSAVAVDGGSPAVHPEQERCPDEVATHGLYENEQYGFSFQIPDGLDGLWNSAGCAPDPQYGCICMGDHGRIIPLTPEPYEPDRHVEVYAGWNALESKTSADRVRLSISWARERGDTRVEKMRKFRLDGSDARRQVAHVVDRERNQRMVRDVIGLVEEGKEFTISLVTKEENYPKDRLVFERIAKSWKHIPTEE